MIFHDEDAWKQFSNREYVLMWACKEKRQKWLIPGV